MRFKILLTAYILFSTASFVLSQSDTLLIIENIEVKGDKITHKPIIIRELEFTEGEIISESLLDEKIIKSQQNLLNRSLFNFVTIEKTVNNGMVDILITVIERWYIWPIPIIEYADRNFNVWWETKDLSRLNYGLDLRIENFRGRMETLNIIVKGGYDQMIAAKWQLPYITKSQTFGLGFEGGYIRNHEIAYTSKDNRYENYKSDNSFVQQQGFATINATIRPQFNFLHQFGIIYNHLEVQDTVLDLNPNYTTGDTLYNYFSLGYTYKHDFRDFKQYPLKGYYIDASMRKTGLGLLSDDINEFSVMVNFDHYLNISRRWHFAYGLSGKLTWSENDQPYFLAKGIGLEGFDIRGYELALINGQNLGVVKSNLKFTIIPKTNFNIKWIKSDKFSKIFYALYTNLFFDFGYADDKYFAENNPLNNQLIWGTGIGIDLVTYYDIVLRLEYAINKQGKTGLYVSLVAPI